MFLLSLLLRYAFEACFRGCCSYYFANVSLPRTPLHPEENPNGKLLDGENVPTRVTLRNLRKSLCKISP